MILPEYLAPLPIDHAFFNRQFVGRIQIPTQELQQRAIANTLLCPEWHEGIYKMRRRV